MLVANDEKFQLDLICMTFENKFDISPLRAINGKIALELVMENITQIENFNKKEIKDEKNRPRHFDAIILDLNMPIMDGSEACKFILDYYSRYNKKKQIYGDK